MRSGKWWLIASAVAVLQLTWGANSLMAQGFPRQPVRLVVGFAPGGGGDVSARLVAGAIQGPLGQSVIVENRPGAGGSLAANQVAKAPADGYTLLVTDQGATVFGSSMFKGLTFEPAKDLAIVSPIFRTSFVLVAGPAFKGNNLKDLLDEARANPGKISYGHSGVGTLHHLSIEMFKQRTNLDLTAVAYKGGQLSVQDALSGQVTFAVSGLLTTEKLIQAGRLKLLAVTSKGRFPEYPNVPALSEIVPGFEAVTWVGIWGPAGMPRDAVGRLNDEIRKALATPEVAKKFSDLGLEALPRTLEETNQFWQSELAVWPDAIRKMRISVE